MKLQLSDLNSLRTQIASSRSVENPDWVRGVKEQSAVR